VATTYPLQIFAMDRLVFEAEVESLVAPGSEGSLGVLAHHAPLITELAAGVLRLRLSDGTSQAFRINGGLLEVGGNRATVLADGKVAEA
jgi:F-type H+-transporting ATPase subunit epsilon